MSERQLWTQETRGQVGIGTLLLFIVGIIITALVVGTVGSIALDYTQQSDQTGDDVQQQINGQLTVMNVVGTTYSGSREIETVRLLVEPAGSQTAIDFNKGTFQYQSDSASKSLTRKTGTGSESAADANEFVTASVGSGPSARLDSQDQKLRIFVNVGAVESAEGGALEEGDSATLTYVAQGGGETEIELTVPSEFTSSTRTVQL